MAGLWYRAGTVSVTNGSNKITGFGTTWKTGGNRPDKGHTFWGPDGKHYEVDSIESDTVLYLVKEYTGVTAAGQPYEIDTTRSGTIPALSRDVSAMLAYAQGQYDSWQQILTGSGDVTLTAPDGRSVTIPSLANMLSKSGNLAGLADKAAARTNIGAYKQGDAAGADVNSLLDTGEYHVNGVGQNWAWPGNGGSLFVHRVSGDDYVTQVAVHGSTGQMASRAKIPTGWRPWQFVIRDSDLNMDSGTWAGYINGVTPAAINCTYVRHGNIVHIRAYLSLNGVTVPANDGQLRGLPFIPKGFGVGSFTPCSIYRTGVTEAHLNGCVSGGSSSIYLDSDSGTSAISVQFKSGAQYMFSCTYEI